MARIAGVDLPREKRVQVGLTYVYGIGQTTARARSARSLTRRSKEVLRNGKCK